MKLKILVSRDGLQDTDAALARGFEACGHQVYLCPIAHQYQFLDVVRTEGIDLSVHRCYSHNPYEGMRILRREGHKCKFVYWEKGWPRFLRLDNPNRRAFDVCFTACNDQSGILLPQASEDHGSLRKNSAYGLTLVAANKADSNPIWGAVRPVLHARLRSDLGNPFAGGLYTLHSKVHPYHERFKIIANSWASIGIWNVDSGVPLRHFEIISCGTPLFSHPFPEMRNHFTPGKHYIEAEDLKAAVEYYRDHQQELNDIAAAGYTHFKENHTYAHRAAQIISTVERLS